jgi:hypothetical protein
MDYLEEQSNGRARWSAAAFIPIVVLMATWMLPNRQPLLRDAIGRFQLFMVFLCPAVGTVISFIRAFRFPAVGKGLFVATGIGYVLLLALVGLIALSPDWGML